MNQPRVNLPLTLDELISICCQLSIGKTFTKQVDRGRVSNVMRRIEKRLKTIGVPEEAILKLIKLAR